MALFEDAKKKQQRIHQGETTAVNTRSENKDCKQQNQPGFD